MSLLDDKKEGAGGATAALEFEPVSPESLLSQGNALHTQRKFEQAVACYQRAIELAPNLAVAHSDLGVAYMELGRLEESIASLNTALRLQPNSAAAHLNLGATLAKQGKLEQAVACYKKSLQLSPGYALAHHNLGNAYRDLDRLPESLEHYQMALKHKPQFAAAYVDMAWALVKQGRPDDAIAACRKAIEVNPSHARAYQSLGYFLNQLGRYDESCPILEKAVQVNPRFAEAYSNLAFALYKQGKFDEAGAYCHKILDLNSADPAAYRTLGLIAADSGDFNEAASCNLKELELNSSSSEVSSLAQELGRLLIELRRIPIVYGDAEEIKRYRDIHIACLHEALSLVSNGLSLNKRDRRILTALLFDTSNFFVAYQQLNDKDVQCAYAKIAAYIVKADIDSVCSVNEQPGDLRFQVDSRESRDCHTAGSKIRLGIASSLLGNHNGSVWAYNLLAKLPASDYEFFIYSLNGDVDHATQKFASLGTYRWLPFVASNYVNSCRIIKDDGLDVLIFTDVGMTGQSKVVSLMRLAPIQCVGRGHPVTTGSENVDFFLTSDPMETEESDSHYSERLVRMPNLGWYLNPPILPSVTNVPRSDFGIPEDRVVYASTQSLFKYLPQYDYVFPAIVKQVPNAFFAFVGQKAKLVTDTFEARIRKAFDEAGVDFEEHAMVLPRMPFERYMQFLNVLDVNLDSIGWCGGNTTRHSLAVNVPVVTLSGEFMRGRHSHAMLKVMGVDELIASSCDEYISIATKLGTNKKFRLCVSQKIKETKHKLYEDMEPVEYLDGFLKSEVNKMRQGS